MTNARGTEYRKNRLIVIKRDKDICQKCLIKVTGEKAHTHHIGDADDHDPINLMLFCNRCHPPDRNSDFWDWLYNGHGYWDGFIGNNICKMIRAYEDERGRSLLRMQGLEGDDLMGDLKKVIHMSERMIYHSLTNGRNWDKDKFIKPDILLIHKKHKQQEELWRKRYPESVKSAEEIGREFDANMKFLKDSLYAEEE